MSCTKVNVIILGQVTTFLDNYVVVAFFVSLVVTLITVLLLVKCITYYMHKDRMRIQENLRVKVPRTQPVDDGDSDSEFNELFSDDSEEDVDIEVNAVKSLESEEGGAQNEDLQTNYVSIVSGEANLENNHVSHPLLIELQHNFDTVLSSFVPNDSITKSLFPHMYSMGPSNIDVFNLFYSKLIEFVWLRKSVILQLLSFMLSLLCEMHFLSRDESMNLQGKYEQEIEDHSTTEFHFDLSFGVAIKNIVNSICEDLKKTSSPVDTKTIDNITNCFYLIHFECLKCLTYEFSVIEDVVEKHERLRIETITEVQCFQLQMKTRVLSIQKYIDTNEIDKSKMAAAIKDYKQKVAEALEVLGTSFNEELQNTIRMIDKHKSDECDKLLSKHERDFSLLKYEMSQTKSKPIEETVGEFREFIILLYKEYMKEKKELIIELNNREGLQLKSLYKRQYKAVVANLNDIEGVFFSSLLDTFNYTEDRVVSITKNIENHLKDVKQKCIVIKKHILSKYISIVKNWIKFTKIIIDYIIKTVSSEFRCIKNTFKATLHQIPMFTDEIITGVLNSVQRKFSVVVFDIVVTLVEDIIKTMRQACVGRETNPYNFICSLLDLRDEIVNNGNNISISIDMFDWLLPPQVNLNEFPVEEMLDKYKSTIFTVLNDIVTVIINEEIEPLQTKTTLDHFEKQFEIYKTVRDIITSEEDKSADGTKKTKKYMSRKGGSNLEKRKVDKLFETYSSLVGMKETKILELSKMYESKKVSKLPGKDKSASLLASCIALLKKQLSDDENDLNSDNFINIFKCEEEYMIKRFAKKLKLVMESDNEEEDTLKTTKKGSKGFKSRNTVSPESPLKTIEEEASKLRRKKGKR